MAGSPECPVKISYRREKRQQQEEQRETNLQQSSSYLSSPARSTGHINQSSIIIDALKEEIGRSQEILLNRITRLEEKRDAVHEQQAALR